MTTVGYEYLRQALDLKTFDIEQPAIVKPVTRIEPTETALFIPRNVAPQTEDPLEHLLFSLKHEGTNLQVLSQALPIISGQRLIDEIRLAPNSAYVRIACYLWEQFSGESLEDVPTIGGSVAPLFDPARYITLPGGAKNTKWRVEFNGLGSFDFCPSVRKTASIDEWMARDVLGQANAFVHTLDRAMMDRTLSWAYLSETENSFAIEKETAKADKAELFVTLLRQAHNDTPLGEDYLSQLQSSCVSNPLDRAASFRAEQNWLKNNSRGAVGITYLPPPPALARRVMQGLMDFANTQSKYLDPIVMAGINSFGFVFAHPFMDGNGRLSRFLFHHALCQSGKIEKGLLLPVSVAMKRNELDYLASLQSFSKKARQQWDVTWIDGDNFIFDFRGHESIYSYWDATRCVEFGFQMANEALEIDLKQETELLARYDEIYKQVDASIDVRGSSLSDLVMACLQNNGVVSQNKRKKYSDHVTSEAFDLIEHTVADKKSSRPKPGKS